MIAAVTMTLVAALADTSSAAQASQSSSRRYALIIGVNKPAKADQRALRYADDDAVRFFEVFRLLSGEAALFALLDPETQRLYPEVTSEAEIPEKNLIFSRADRMFDRIRADREQGLTTELYLIYSGHGYVDDTGEGRLGLEDGTFSRTELYDRLLARSPAHVNHVIVDACDAYFFVQARGADPNVEAVLQARAKEFLDRQTLARFPNTGAILSTASAAESHEWSEIRGGVFSHEVRSALLGAADADQNGSISYDELEAFVLAANIGVRHVSAARAIFVRAPQRDREHPVIDLGSMRRAHRLTIGPGVSGRIAVADEQGRRYLDLNKASGFALALRLLPGVRYFVRLGELDHQVPSGEPEIDLSDLAGFEPTTAARGAGIADAYAKGLFAVPFGPQLVDGFRLGLGAQEATAVVRSEARPLKTAAWIAGGAALAAGALGGAFYVAGNPAHEAYLRYQGPDQEHLNRLSQDVQAWDTRTSFAIGAAVSLGVTAGALFLLDALGVGQ